jgi:hypothetical protein
MLELQNNLVSIDVDSKIMAKTLQKGSRHIDLKSKSKSTLIKQTNNRHRQCNIVTNVIPKSKSRSMLA